MSVSAEARRIVRERANFCCEYCGVSEQDTGGELTIDHFQPQAKSGTDDLTNLLCCCQRCNQYKADYWPEDEAAPALWNPRQEHGRNYFVLLADGTLYPRTAVGTFTSTRLRLNRSPLVAHRLREMRRTEEVDVLTQLRDVLGTLEQLHAHHASLLDQQRQLLEAQRALITLLLQQQGRTSE